MENYIILYLVFSYFFTLGVIVGVNHENPKTKNRVMDFFVFIFSPATMPFLIGLFQYRNNEN
jgi:hypothetical protein